MIAGPLSSLLRQYHPHQASIGTACAEIMEAGSSGAEGTSLASVQAGPWQACSSSCGSGWQERPLTCAALPGYLSEAGQCSAAGMQTAPTSNPCRSASMLAWQQAVFLVAAPAQEDLQSMTTFPTHILGTEVCRSFFAAEACLQI